jgi:hypothetical protein
MLTIIQIVPECRDAAGPAQLRRGTLLMRILTKVEKGYMKRIVGMEVP